MVSPGAGRDKLDEIIKEEMSHIQVISAQLLKLRG